jgi:hypothetical protein
MTINPDSISEVLTLATVDELVSELRRRGACYAVFRESDVLAQVQTGLDFQGEEEAQQRRIAEKIFENNVEFIQDAMVRAGQEAIRDLISSYAEDKELLEF